MQEWGEWYCRAVCVPVAVPGVTLERDDVGFGSRVDARILPAAGDTMRIHSTKEQDLFVQCGGHEYRLRPTAACAMATIDAMLALHKPAAFEVLLDVAGAEPEAAVPGMQSLLATARQLSQALPSLPSSQRQRTLLRAWATILC